jgi:hypothetical protein
MPPIPASLSLSAARGTAVQPACSPFAVNTAEKVRDQMASTLPVMGSTMPVMYPEHTGEARNT